MSARELWQIVDRRTGRRATVVSFLTRKQAEDQITEWQDRHDRGGRPDVTRDTLLHMTPERVA